MKEFVSQYQNLGGSWTVTWSFMFMGRKRRFQTIEPCKRKIT